jgi:LacI family transcriptional regulator
VALQRQEEGHAGHGHHHHAGLERAVVADGLREAGARLPEDVAPVGVDNWEALAMNCRPPLTTVDLNLEFVGRTAGELLLRAIDGHASGGTHVIQPRLVIRESSGPAGRPAAER